MRRMVRIPLALLLTIVGSSGALDLVMLTDEEAQAKGAVCLDGTNPGFYWTKGNGTGANKWVLYFKGGGWCYDEKSCAARAKTALGSSKYFGKKFQFGGIMDESADSNPTFYNFNRVVLWYCDGASFSGNRDQPDNSTGTLLYFRGRRVLDAMLDVLMANHGLDKAEEVLLSGGSAGGLSTYLHADYVMSRLPSSVKKFKASPVSGFFLLHNNAEGTAVYPDEMRYVFNMQNSTGGVNDACIASLPKAEQWRCIFANYSYAHTKAPIFPFNSALDAWQMGSIWQGDKGCTKNDFRTCSASQVADLNGYMSNFLNDLSNTATFSKAGNGAFIESCLEHCGEQSSTNFDAYKLRGTTMQEAHTKWWESDGTDSAETHTYLPGCTLSTSEPHQCNPSCERKVSPDAFDDGDGNGGHWSD